MPNMIANAKSDLLLCFGISLCTRQIGTKVHEFAKNAEIIRVDIDPYNLQREIHEGREGEKCFCVSAETVVRKLTEQQAQIGSYEEWLAVCQKIRKELWKVDDETPQRYPNRMIAYLSDQLSDTGAVAVDVGSAYGLELSVLPQSAGAEDTFFRRTWCYGICTSGGYRSLLCYRQAGGMYLRRRSLPDEYPGAAVGEA